ncbi:hypothetical protein HZS_1288, partial [Henneguya salminicola]
MSDGKRPYELFNEEDEYFLANELKKLNPNAPQRENTRPGQASQQVVERARFLYDKWMEEAKPCTRPNEIRK